MIGTWLRYRRQPIGHMARQQSRSEAVRRAFCQRFGFSKTGAGHHIGDMMRREFTKLLGEQAGAGARHGGDAAEVEDDELRARLGRELARDVVDIGKRQRADQSTHSPALSRA